MSLLVTNHQHISKYIAYSLIQTKNTTHLNVVDVSEIPVSFINTWMTLSAS